MKHLGFRSLLPLLAVATAVGGVAALAQPSAPGAAAAPAAAAPTPVAAAGAAKAADPRAELTRKIPGTKPEDFRQSPIPGLWELARGADIVYVTADGKYALAGDLYEIASDTNVSERRRREVRLDLINSVPESQMVVFSPKDPKYTVTVFTDIDCGYCRKLHGEIARYNELGIRVRYLFYPRTGPNSESWDKAVAVWCSQNRNDALTRAKRGEDLKVAKCGKTPVDHDYELGQEIGLRGTPAILLANGDMLPGYVPPATLAKRLQSVGR
ncbi:MAG: thioredoxin fold domain-containing protein [Steroidobacteraceae bacterium]|nr:thioredoxin fold domain-containing protein [Steroidobacteraceae bacterium]